MYFMLHLRLFVLPYNCRTRKPSKSLHNTLDVIRDSVQSNTYGLSSKSAYLLYSEPTDRFLETGSIQGKNNTRYRGHGRGFGKSEFPPLACGAAPEIREKPMRTILSGYPTLKLFTLVQLLYATCHYSLICAYAGHLINVLSIVQDALHNFFFNSTDFHQI
jgi:hypothetical protein